MAAIYAYRFLSRDQVQRLFSFSCIRRVNNRLRKLFDHHYLNRSFLPTTRGSGKALYSLGPQGVAVVAKELGMNVRAVKNKTKGLSELKGFFLNHSLELNEIRISLCEAIEKQPELKLERWINDNDCEQTYRVCTNGKVIIKRFRPDGYLRFWYQNKLLGCFLELDRSTMTVGHFAEKVKIYRDFSKLGFYQQRFGLERFRVLVIAPTETRLSNLKSAVEELTRKVFWFTTFNQVTAKNPFGPIWQRAGHNGLFPLISGLDTTHEVLPLLS